METKEIIFDGSKLKMTKDGPVYDENRTVSIEEAFSKVSGGKRYPSAKAAFKDFEISLKELVK